MSEGTQEAEKLPEEVDPTAVLEVTIYPDRILRKTCEPVAEVGMKTNAYLRQMQNTMQKCAGIGIAANQVGLDMAMCLVGSPPDFKDAAKAKALVNPVIIAKSREMGNSQEGCLSLPCAGTVRRYYWVTVRYLDENGFPQETRFEGAQARIVQHEIDHLNGMTIWDKMSPADKSTISGRMKRFVKRRKHVENHGH